MASVACALVMSAALVSGCTSARTSQGTTDESCYLALPTAHKAVGGHGAFAGVRKFSMMQLHGMAPRLYTSVSQGISKRQAVCIAAYKGHFTSSEVRKPIGHPTGTLAVAVVTTPGNKLLGTLILTKVPVRFQHQF
jgi:2-methylaconitate cis-trans-isomerase PrpF